MKRAILTHPKTFDLAARLECSRPTTIGYLSLLFDFCAEHSPQGNIGKWPNGAIAKSCDWDGDVDMFIESLVNSKWLDDSDLHRLVIHDWGTNCDNWVRAKLGRLKLEFYSYDASYEPSYEPSNDTLTVGVGKGKGKGKAKGVFVEPTLAEVTAYCQERKNSVNPQLWINHYTSNGWKVGRASMKDWKAAVCTWEQNGVANNSKPDKDVDYRNVESR